MRPNAASGLLVALCLALFATAEAGATTYVLPPDPALVDRTAVVVQAVVAAVEPSPIAGPPSTDYFVEVERVLKGYVSGGTLVVRVPGGIGPDGAGLKIWGAPSFRLGERSLLFLEPRDDGTYGVRHLMLGAFHEVEAGGRRVAVRDLSEAVELAPEAREGVRDFVAFADWIAARVAGENRPPSSYRLETPLAALASSTAGGGPARDDCTQLNLRWFEFDRGEPVAWSSEARGWDGAGAGRGALDRARRLWNRGGGHVRLSRAPRTRSRAGLVRFDGVNAVLWNDPNDIASGAFHCDGGGVVAVAGVWFDNGRGQSCQPTGASRRGEFRGRPYLEILGADVVVNDGAACLMRIEPGVAAGVLAHELGHTLGLAHGGRGSLMSANLESRDGAPGPLDRAGLRLLYGSKGRAPR